MGEPKHEEPMTSIEAVSAIIELARAYRIMRQTDFDNKYEISEVKDAILRLAKRIAREE